MRVATMFSGILSALAFVGLCISETQADVSIKRSQGTLTLTGDSFGDVLEIAGIGPNQVVVAINGAAPVVYGEVQNIKIDMKKGTDFVCISGIEISGNLDVNTGGDLGDVSVTFESLINGNAAFKGSSDSAMIGCAVGRNLNVEAGLPLDLLDYQGVHGVDGDEEGDEEGEGGNGQSCFSFGEDGFTMLVAESFVAGKATLKGSAQSVDSVCVVENFFANNLGISLGGGADVLAIDENFIGANLTMDGGKGTTDIIFSGVNLIGGKIALKGFELFF